MFLAIWLLTALIFCQNGAETSVTGWLVTYYKNQEILSDVLSTYTVTIMWSATLIARM
jgi:fucose permease